MGWLTGKTALIVGGGSGIGRSVVESFVAEGARVAILEMDPGKCQELTRAYPEALVIQGDATRFEDNQRAVLKTVGEFGKLDTLATFVGVFDFYTSLEEIPDEKLAPAFDEIFEVNVKSCLLTAKAALDPLSAARGNIILTVSSAGFYPGRVGVLYVGSKFAVRGLVVQLAHDLAPAIRVNGVAPGGTAGTQLRGLRSLAQENRRLGDRPGREEDLRSRNPLRVALTPEDHSGAYVFLASDRARGITGIVINSDGGMGLGGLSGDAGES